MATSSNISLITDAGLGTINSVVLTVEYLKHQNIKSTGNYFK